MLRGRFYSDNYEYYIKTAKSSIFNQNATISSSFGSFHENIDNNENSIFEVRNDGVFLPNIPTSDPVNAGQLWLDGTTLKVSAGE